MLLQLAVILTLVVLTPPPTEARPVSYPDGWTLMQMNEGNHNSLHMHYSPTARYSIGYRGEFDREQEWQFHGAQLNYLTSRWNAPSEQANLYFKTGLGGVISKENNTNAAAFVGLAADWETRRFFTGYETRYFEAGSLASQFSQKARIGIAPYIGDYGDLHTWLMVEAEHRPEAQHAVTITPLIRLFKGVSLLEAGISNHGEILLNTIIRF